MEWNNSDRFKSENPKAELFDNAQKLLEAIKDLGMHRLQFETEVGTVFLSIKEDSCKEDFNF